MTGLNAVMNLALLPWQFLVLLQALVLVLAGICLYRTTSHALAKQTWRVFPSQFWAEAAGMALFLIGLATAGHRTFLEHQPPLTIHALIFYCGMALLFGAISWEAKA